MTLLFNPPTVDVIKEYTSEYILYRYLDIYSSANIKLNWALTLSNKIMGHHNIYIGIDWGMGHSDRTVNRRGNE